MPAAKYRYQNYPSQNRLKQIRTELVSRAVRRQERKDAESQARAILRRQVNGLMNLPL